MAMLEHALDGARDPELPRVAWEAHALLADALAAAGLVDAAAEHRSAARGVVRTIAATIDDEEARGRFVALTKRRLRAPRR